MIENKIDKLSKIISKYEPYSFIGCINYFIHFHFKQNSPDVWKGKVKKTLKSPVRQFAFLLTIYSENSNGEEVFDFSESDLIFELLDEIESFYEKSMYAQLEGEKVKENYKDYLNSAIGFFDYYFNSDLVYVEQDVDKLRNKYSEHEDSITSIFNLRIDEFVDFYKDSMSVFKMGMLLTFSKMEDETFRDILNSLNDVRDYNLLTEQYGEKAIDDFLDYLSDPSCYMHFNESMYKKVGSKISENNLSFLLDKLSFSSSKNKSEKRVYYTDSPIVFDKPFFKNPSGNYILVFDQYLPKAIMKLIDEGLANRGVIIDKIRDKFLEERTYKLFSKYFGDKYNGYSNYYIGSGSEKDILFTTKNKVFIIECKANKIKERFRNLEKSINRLNQEHKKVLQKGFSQAFEVSSFIEQNSNLNITTNKGKLLKQIEFDEKIKNFHIVVTDSRFGLIQNNLFKIENSKKNSYIYSIGIDDLECFLMILARQSKTEIPLVNFLVLRSRMHGRVHAYDELDMQGWYLMRKDEFRYASKSDKDLLTDGTFFQVFDDLYYIGFGFKDEDVLEKRKRVELDGFKVEENLNLIHPYKSRMICT